MLDGTFDDELFVEALQAGSALDPALSLEVGRARADAVVTDAAPAFEGDALRFLREEASRFYRDRSTYGASSVELSPAKAVVRFVASEAFVRRAGDAQNRAPDLVQGYLERAVEIVSGTAQAARYVGHAPRIDARFDRPMVNLIFEFDLDAA
jgi:hypothetical protein